MIIRFKGNILRGKSNKGFSLIELVVALALFLVIIGVMVDVFFSVVQHQKRILEEQELLNQTSYLEEYMSTALKMAAKAPNNTCLGGQGKVYLLTHCNNGILQACNGVKFINQLNNNACQEFFLDTSVNPAVFKEIKNGQSAKNILSDKFTVQYARFILNGDKTLHVASSNDSLQPRITLLLDVKTQTPGNQEEKIIQTTISQRNINR